MALDIGLRIAQALNSIGIKMGSYVGKSSNVRKAMFGGKPTMFKPHALETLRGTNGTFDDALKLIEEEAQFIVNATDAEKMAFLNNVNEYKEFGGPLKTKTSGILNTDEAKNLTNEAKDLETSITDLQTTAQSMKDEATKNLKSAEDDLAAFFETGGNPLNKKDKKFLGGSMSEEGQIRTGVREFLKKEFKNGRINLDETDAQRILQYSPMSEDDPILVFKKIYGDEAYNKAGSFPGAFDVGESYNHYESIFRSKMGEDFLKVKDKKYVGDGKLVLTESEEVFTPSKFDDDVPFAEGGIADVRVGFVKGKAATAAKNKVKQIIEYITSKFTPIDAMKEVNKVIGKTGKYKNLKLTQKDIDEIVENTEDFIFQRDPDNQFVEGSIKEKTEYLDEDDVLERDLFAPKSDTQVFKDSEGGIKGITIGGDDEFKKGMSEAMEEGMRESENMKRLGLDPSKQSDFFKYEKMKEDGQLEKNVTGLSDMSESEALMKKYPGMGKELAEQIATDTNPKRKADVIAMVEQTFELNKQGKSGDEIIDIFKKGTDRTKQADGGITQLRNGYYGGGQAMVGEDLSQIGHGADALMARNMQLAPNSMATTSTGLNYLLGEDNDTVRVPYNNGKKVKEPNPKVLELMLNEKMSYPDALKELKMRERQQPYIDERYNMGPGPILEAAEGGRIGYNEGNMVLPKPKPAQSPLVELSKIYKTYEEAMPGVSKDTQQYLQQDFIQKLNDAGISQEAFMTYKMQNNFADGGRIGYNNGKLVNEMLEMTFPDNYYKNVIEPAKLGTGPVPSKTQMMMKSQPFKAVSMQLQNYLSPGKYDTFRAAGTPLATKALGIGKKALGIGAKILGPASFLFDAAPANADEIDMTSEDFMKMRHIDKKKQEKIKQQTGIFKEIEAAEAAKAAATTERASYMAQAQRNADRRDPGQGNTVTGFGKSGLGRDPDDKMADGGRIGYVGGGGVNLGRRGFLKLLGATTAGVAALKSGLVKILGKTATKAVPKMVTIPPGSGAPAWFEGMVNKVLADGIDITKTASTLDGQVVKSLDTPTGTVDVTFDTRTGSIDAFYKGENTAMGESVDMRYTVGQADEGTKGVKPADEFEAVEAVPEFQGGNYMDGPDLGFGENSVSDIKGLYSDTSELAELGGQKILIKDISETIKKKKVLKEMDNNPQEFAQDMEPDVYYDD